MQLVRTLALVAALGVVRAAAQDNGSPSPVPAPSTAAPATTDPTPTATTPAPGVTTPAPDATTAAPTATAAAPDAPSTPAPSIVATGTPEGEFTRVQITSQSAQVELSTNGDELIVSDSEGGSSSIPTVAKMRWLVGANTSRASVVSVVSDVVTELEIGSYQPSRHASLSFSDYGLSNASNLASLTFVNINFYMETQALNVPDKLAYLKINGSNLVDLSVTSTQLSKVDFTNSGFKTLPYLFYQRKYDVGLEVNSDFTIDASASTALSADEYANAQHNLADEAASIVTFSETCASASAAAGSVTDLDRRHVVCLDPLRAGVRKLGQTNTLVATTDAPTTPAPTPRGSDSNTTLTVIVIVIAVIAAVLAYFVARRYFCLSASARAARSPRFHERTVGLISKDEPHGGGVAAGSGQPGKLSFISSDDALRQIRLEQQDVSVTKSVGTGRLWVGDYAGRKVMIKRVEAESTDSYATKALITQARALAPLAHPNLVALVGVTWVQGTDFGVVGEFMDKGTLKAVLMDLDTELDLHSKLHMCLDVARALQYLHSAERNLYMKRLTSRKVLVNGAVECKLNLFECHPCATKVEYPEVFGAGELAWLAPELITRTGVLDSRKINIFSLGVVIGEIMTRASPYQSAVDAVGHTLADLELAKRIKRQERLLPHENRHEFTELPPVLRDLVGRCLSYQPLSRPTADEIVQCLESVKDYSERVGSTTSL